MSAINENNQHADKTDLMIVVAMVTLLASFLIRETLDADTWWQVAIGRDILERLTVPSLDHFSIAAFGRSYHDSHWLFQVMLALADRVAGMSGVSVLMIGVWAMTLTACYRAMRLWLSVSSASLMLLLVAIAVNDRFTPRPDLITCGMIAIFYLRLVQGRFRNFRELALLGILQVVWANAHGLFVMGPFLAFCYWLSALLRKLRGDGVEFVPTSRLLVTITVASLITPFGWKGWQYAILLAKEANPLVSSLFTSLAELSPTFGAQARSAPDFWCYITLLLGTIVTILPLALQKKIPLERLLIVVALAAVSFMGRRNIPLFALTAAPFIAENTALLLPKFPLFKTPWRWVVVSPLLLLSWFPLSGKYYQYLHYPIRFGLGATPSFFPLQLPEFLHASGFRGQIFNSNNLGGFCLYYGYRPLTDGRWEVYDPAVLNKILESSGNWPLWQEVVARYDIKGVMLQHLSTEGIALLPKLSRDPRWRLVYYDHCASFWVRDDQPGQPPALIPGRSANPYPHPQRVEDYLMLGSFYRSVGAAEAGVTVLEQALVAGGRREEVLEQLGRLQTETGRLLQAEQTFTLLYREYPDNVTALNELAFHAVRRGDRATAAGYLRRALELNPNDPDIRANYDRLRYEGGR